MYGLMSKLSQQKRAFTLNARLLILRQMILLSIYIKEILPLIEALLHGPHQARLRLPAR
jgi:hypothetical protein